MCCDLIGNGAMKFSMSDLELSSSVLWYSFNGSIMVTLSPSAFGANLPFTVRSESGGLEENSEDDAITKFCSLISHCRTLSLKFVYISVWYRQRAQMFVGRPSFADTWKEKFKL